MTDLIVFLLAQLALDEAAAKAAQMRFPGPWDRAVAPDSPLPSAVSLYDSRDESLGVIRGSYAADHIARHDPARVLREVAAKRAIVALHKTDIDPADALYGSNARCEECGTYVVLTGPCKALRILAAIWVDHPDYRQEWKP